MATRFEIHVRDLDAADGARQLFGEYAVKQIEVFAQRRARPIMMGHFTMNTAINTVVSWCTSKDITGWVTFRALEKWLSRIGSQTYFQDTGITFDPRSVEDAGESTNLVDNAMEDTMAHLGKRFGHRPMPIALAQVVDAYAEAREFKALLEYLRQLHPEMLL